jgi:GTP-binding protein EngB required for normal cell division
VTPTPRRAAALTERLDVLREVVARAPGRLPDDVAGRAVGVLGQADQRLAHGSAHTVVALAGATGSGKSSLFNALVGEPLAAVGVRRPTTATARAAVFGGGAEGLLDWLEVPHRHVVAGADLDGLVLLDLPDHDSVEAAHRDEVDRLVRVVDTFLWVLDPQKYADAALHHRYLSRFAAHGAVSVAVVNRIDEVPDEHDRRALLDHVGRLLAADGLTGVRTIATSTTAGDGLDALRRELAARVAARQALLARLDADLDWLVDDLRAAAGDGTPRPLDDAARRRVVGAMAAAAGVDAVADAAGAAHRHRSARRAGWPPVRWVGRLRPDPLRRLGLERAPADGEPTDRPDAVVGRTSRPGPTAVAEAAVDEALREVSGRAGAGLPEPWGRRLHDVAVERRHDVADALDVAVASTSLPTGTPRWWAVAALAQRAATAAMVVGLVWLLVVGVVAWFGLPDLPTPELGEVPVPTVLALGGAVVGLVVAALARWAAAVGGRRRAAQARRELTSGVERVARELVVEPLDAELAAMAGLGDLVRRLDR